MAKGRSGVLLHRQNDSELFFQEKTALRKGNSSVVAGSLKESKNRSLTQSRILLPHATLDLSNGFNGTIMAKSLELSTLV